MGGTAPQRLDRVKQIRQKPGLLQKLRKDLTIAIHTLSETIGIVADMADGIRSGSEEITRQPTTCRAGPNKGNLKERLLPQSNYGTGERADGGVLQTDRFDHSVYCAAHERNRRLGHRRDGSDR
jgi:hypothetical protein